jgi:hypothetical protein
MGLKIRRTVLLKNLTSISGLFIFLELKVRNINWLILNIETVFLLVHLIGRSSSPLDRLIPSSTCIVSITSHSLKNHDKVNDIWC